ncbi:MAG: hypothetical protein VB031_07325 [Eubacteriaceae bacterium]|nr:hypothetical protein [Eubacteriaceae bacterium]
MNIIRHTSIKIIIGLGILTAVFPVLVHLGIIENGIAMASFYIAVISGEFIAFFYYLLRHRKNKMLSCTMIVVIITVASYVALS